MKYISKKFFQQLDFYKLVIVIDLQVLGVASIWGYSEIFGFRIGYSRNWAIFTSVFVALSAVRFILTNVPRFSSWYITQALKSPMKTLRVKSSHSVIKYFGVLYTIALDITLQVLGAASIWAYSEICGFRTNPRQNDIWGNVTIACSTIAFVRYSMQSFHAFYNTEIIYPPTGHVRYFEAGLFDILSIKKSILRDIGCYCSCSWIQTTLSPHKYSEAVYDADAAHRLVTVSTLDACLFYCGLCLHFVLTIVFEILGAGGAIWGQAEIWQLRKSATSSTYIICATICSLVVFISLMWDYWKTSFALPTGSQMRVDGESGGNMVMVEGRDNPFTELTPITTLNPMQGDIEFVSSRTPGEVFTDLMRMGPTVAGRNPSTDNYSSLPAMDIAHHDDLSTHSDQAFPDMNIAKKAKEECCESTSHIGQIDEMSLNSDADVRHASSDGGSGGDMGDIMLPSSRSGPCTPLSASTPPRIPPPQSPQPPRSTSDMDPLDSSVNY
jgi:hypothetical protein